MEKGRLTYILPSPGREKDEPLRALPLRAAHIRVLLLPFGYSALVGILHFYFAFWYWLAVGWTVH